MGPEVAGDQGEVTVVPANLLHGLITGVIIGILGQFVHERKPGVVLGAETGFLMQQEPPELRAPNIAFVYPEEREIEVFRPGQPTQTLGLDDVLEGEDVLPGFSVALKEIFASLDVVADDE